MGASSSAFDCGTGLFSCGGYEKPPPRKCLWTGKSLPSVAPTELLPVLPDARRRALLIGINYQGQGPDIELEGAANDALRMRDFLINRQLGWPSGPDHMRVLLNHEANRKAIVEGMKWLCWGARPGDSLFFFFAGHGSQTPDLDGDEDDGLDETILPVDFRDPQQGHILDDLMWEIMVKPLPAGCRLTAVMDCCHSGTGLDLPYGLVTTREDWAKYQSGQATPYQSLQPLSELEVRHRSSNGDVLLFSGCCDDQTSEDSSDIQAEFELKFPALFAKRQMPEEEDEATQKWRAEQYAADRAPLPEDSRPAAVEEEENDFAGTLDEGEDWLAGMFGSDKAAKPSRDPDRKARKITIGGAGPPGMIVGKLRPDGSRAPAKSGGALTTALTVLMKKWENEEGVTYDKLLYGIREVLEKCSFDQKPQLSGSRPFMISVPVQL
eukprot:TRINITY_DN13623_c0_g1_i1.p1 TRINITY_DN13623_c0_g1~~TRINITY_DN13623_c0_g1_i1.p1  ORF type:complete len:437 (+),score=131.31 TRINITY_DN13623_c0_g1_i1:110-1420(+)